MSRILIVDDHPEEVTKAASELQEQGYEVVLAESAARALNLVGRCSFDVIFTDVLMPDRDGFGLLEDLRERGVQTPVAMISGKATWTEAVRALELNVLQILDKPIGGAKL